MARGSSSHRPAVTGRTQGPDKKGRFWLPLPSGQPLLFYGGAPDETVTARRGRKGRRGEQGDLLEVQEGHPQRRLAPCPHYGVCGGCTLQHLAESTALDLKSRPLYQALAQSYPEAQAFPPVSSPRSFAYRTKIELSFLHEAQGGTKLGFHRRGRFDRLVDLERCWLSPLGSAALTGTREWAQAQGLRGWDPRSHEGQLRYLLYRSASDSSQNLMVLVLQEGTTLSEAALAELRQTWQTAGIHAGRLLWQSSPAGAIVPDREEPLYGPQTWLEPLGGLQLELSWRSFYQVNPPIYQRMLETMQGWRQTPVGGRLLDLYCGVGSIGLYLQRPGDRLVGVESVPQAVEDARSNALRNSREAQFVCRPAEDWGDLSCDLLLLDPPRSGLHPRLLRELSLRPPASELFYISCNPYQLLQELPELSASYQLLAYQAFDFFPQTHHVELLLHLRAHRAPAPSPPSSPEA